MPREQGKGGGRGKKKLFLNGRKGLPFNKNTPAATEEVNEIQRVRLYLMADIGSLLPPTPRGKRGQGRNGKKSTALSAVDLSFDSATG
jgi:hypothetical protein